MPDIFLYAGETNPNDVRLRDPTTGGFPAQILGLRGQLTSGTVDLCLVAEAYAPAAMGGVPKIRKGASTYVVYLVETGDANASPFRIRTTTGTKAIRLKT